MKISGVTAGSPAANAGLLGGDIIVGMGTHDVADLQGLTDALRAHKPGQTVPVRVMRDGKERDAEGDARSEKVVQLRICDLRLRIASGHCAIGN